jgi:hypothetical protein
MVARQPCNCLRRTWDAGQAGGCLLKRCLDECYRIILRKRETRPAARRWKQDQQLGRTRHRDRAGSTGRTGRSENGWRVVFLFLISIFSPLEGQYYGEYTEV